jgi:hypothetical protein
MRKCFQSKTGGLSSGSDRINERSGLWPPGMLTARIVAKLRLARVRRGL